MANEKNKQRRGGFDLNNEFPRILTLLRKERGYSQKKVSADLGISQALLSHYEKGIRECGLDFVVRVADYYNVSCDYLLGRTPHRSGAVINLRESVPTETGVKMKKSEKGSAEYSRRVISNSLNIVFAILKKINSDTLTSEISLYLSACIYKIFRVLYSSNPKNPQSAFSLDSRLSGATIQSTMAMAEAKSRYILSGDSLGGKDGVKKEALPQITFENLSNEYPQWTPSLLDMIERTEKAAKSAK